MRLKKTRIVAAGLCLAVAVTCTGCKSQEVKDTEALISQIGQVTIDHNDALEKARDAYDALGDEQKDVKNASELQAAIDEYDKLTQDEANVIIGYINSIPQPYDITDSQTISAANRAKQYYDSSTDDIKAKVSNYSILNEVLTAIGDDAVQKAVAAIDQIGTVTAESGDKINAAKDACAKVPADRLSDVTNYQTFTDAQDAYSKAQKEAQDAEGKAAVGKLKTEKDEVEGITWHKPSSYPKYSNDRCFVLPYIGEKSGHYWLRCKVDYAANDWVFFTSIIFNVDGVKRDTINFDYYDVTRETVLGGKLYETADFAPTESQINLLRDIADSQKTIIRFQGSDYYYDYTVQDKDKNGIKDVLAAYDYLK